MRSNGISVISNRRHISLPVEDILYVQLAGRRAVIHASGGRIYETYTTIMERRLFSANSIASRCCSLRRMSPARSSLGISMTGKAGSLRMSASRSAAVTSYAEIQMLVL